MFHDQDISTKAMVLMWYICLQVKYHRAAITSIKTDNFITVYGNISWSFGLRIIIVAVVFIGCEGGRCKGSHRT